MIERRKKQIQTYHKRREIDRRVDNGSSTPVDTSYSSGSYGSFDSSPSSSPDTSSDSSYSGGGGSFDGGGSSGDW